MKHGSIQISFTSKLLRDALLDTTIIHHEIINILKYRYLYCTE